MNTALVTGSAGFVGRHMAAELESRGYSVARCDIETGDDAFQAYLSDNWVYDLVVHAAARSPHRAAIDGKPEIFPYNVMLDAALFNWAITTGQRRILYLSSSAAYPTIYQRGRWALRLKEQMISEDIPVLPDSSYGWVKLTGERMATAARAAGVPVTVVRPFSGYGTDQSDDFPFRAMVERARRRDEPFVIWGDGNQVRDWIHIDDLVAGALAMVEAGVDAEINLCTGRGVSMRELAEMVCVEAGYMPTFEFQRARPNGVEFRVGDPTWMYEFYRPQISLEDGVKRALANE